MCLHARVYALRLLEEPGSRSNKMSPTREVFGVCEEVRGGSMVFLFGNSLLKYFIRLSDYFHSNVTLQRPLRNHDSHQQIDPCAVGPEVTKAVSEPLFVSTSLR